MSRQASRTHSLFPLGHEMFLRAVPEIAEIIKQTTEGARRLALAGDGETLAVADLLKVPFFSRWVDGVYARAEDGGRAAEDVFCVVGPYIQAGVNFELARRKVFWVDEALAF